MRNLCLRTNAAATPAFYSNHLIVLFLSVLFTFSLSKTSGQTFRNSSQASAGDNVKSLTVNKPSGLQAGDVMVAAIAVRPYNANVTKPSPDWTLISNISNSRGNGDNSQYVYYKVATASDVTSNSGYLWQFNQSEGSVGGIIAFSDIETNFNPVDKDSGSTSGGTSTLTFKTPSVNTNYAGEMVIGIHSFGSSAPWNNPTGNTFSMIQAIDKSSITPTPNELGISMEMSYGVWPTASATGQVSATVNASLTYAETGVSQIITLIPKTTISYPDAPYCTNEGTVPITFKGITGGTYSSTSGLSIDPKTGAVNLSTSTPSATPYKVTYRYGTNSQYSVYTEITVFSSATVSTSVTPTCVDGSTGTITASASGGAGTYTYSINGTTYQTSNIFNGLAAGNYTLYVKTATGCITSTGVTVVPYSNSTDNQNAAGTDAWLGHIYNIRPFVNYIGNFSESETFDESFGGSATCFTVKSGSVAPSIYTEDFGVKFLMNSTKKGLYVADLGSDDGSRLTVDNNLVYNNWTDHGYVVIPNVLMNLSGSSSLKYEYYENGGGNQVTFKNLRLVLANSLSVNTTQSMCLGSAGNAVSGDAFSTPLLNGLSNAGYQWSYSTSLTGTPTDIPGATGATFTPNTNTAPFNVAGTYYLFRSASVTSANNTGITSFKATNLSNAATITVNTATVAGTVSAGTTVCSGANTGMLTVTGQTGSVTRWEYLVNGGSWTALSNTTTSYTYTNLTQTTQYRAVVKNGECPAVNSSVSTITVTPLATASIAGSTTVCQNAASPVITFTATGGTAPYTFTYKINTGANQTVVATTGNLATVSVPTTTAGIFTYTLVSVSSASCSQNQSGSATVTVASPIANNQLSVATGITGVICATAAENGSATLTAPEGALFIGINFASYGTPNGSCSAFTTGGCNAASSQTVVENYLLGKNGATIPANNTTFGDPCSGTVKRLSVQATYIQSIICAGTSPGTITGTNPTGGSGTYTYLWEVSTTSASSGFTSASGTNTDQNYTPGVLNQTTWFRRTVLSGGCSNVSSVIQVTVSPISVGGTVNGSTTVCSGSNNGTLTLSGQTGNVLQWEFSVDNGINWTTVSNTTTSLSYTNLTLTTKYRAVVQSGACLIAKATAGTITVAPLPTATISGTTTVCQNSTSPGITFTGVSATSPYTFTYTVNNGANQTVTTTSGSAVVVPQSTTTSGVYTYTLVSVSSASCTQAQSGTAIVTVTPTVGTPNAITIISGTEPTCQISNTSTTTTGYYTTASNSTGLNGSLSNPAAGTINMSTGVVTWTKGFSGTVNIQVTANGCNGPSAQVVRTVTISPLSVGGTANGSTTVCKGSNNGTLTLSGQTGNVLKWEYLVDNGTNWSPISNTTTSLTYTNLTQTTQYRAVVQSGGCTTATSAAATITINSASIWTGDVDTLWNVAGNWQCEMLPTITTNVLIPSGRKNYPVIKSGIVGLSNNLDIKSGATITVRSGNLKIGGVVTATGSNIIATEGKTEFVGIAAQSIPANLFYSNTIKDLVITNSADVNLNGDLRITHSVGFGNIDNSILYSNGYLTLASSSSYTANFLDATNGGVNTGNAISGNVTVERYIPPKRAYRFLTAPVNSPYTIKQNWMEGALNSGYWNNQDPNKHYGTNISGSGSNANGFDYTATANPSMYTYDNIGQKWNPIPNTSALMSVGIPYRIIVRGDRTVDMSINNPTPTPTTLRAKGSLITGNVTLTKSGGGGTAGMPVISDVAGSYSFVANPYASAINWLKVTKTNVDSSIYIFDPTVEGANGRGAYVAYNSILKCNNNASSMADNYIQSGQAFFVKPQGLNPSIIFKETDKAENQRPLFRSAGTLPRLSLQLQLPSQIGTNASTDGFAVYFAEDFDSTIGNEDSYKLTNQDENIGIVRSGKTLCLEGRKPVMTTDTISLKMWQLSQSGYALKIAMNDFPQNVEGFLEDKYLKTKTRLTPDSEMVIPFKNISDASSLASDRFSIVFKAATTLPLHLLGIKAYEKNEGIEVKWTAESESEMDKYEVEKSANAVSFATAGTVMAKVNPGPSSAYTWFDLTPFDGTNYYRVKAVDKAGEVKYSSIVSVITATHRSSISVFPNPVTGRVLTLDFKNIKKGNYNISMINNFGQKIYTDVLTHDGGSARHRLSFEKSLAAGVYQLLIVLGDLQEKISVLAK